MPRVFLYAYPPPGDYGITLNRLLDKNSVRLYSRKEAWEHTPVTNGHLRDGGERVGSIRNLHVRPDGSIVVMSDVNETTIREINKGRLAEVSISFNANPEEKRQFTDIALLPTGKAQHSDTFVVSTRPVEFWNLLARHLDKSVPHTLQTHKLLLSMASEAPKEGAPETSAPADRGEPQAKRTSTQSDGESAAKRSTMDVYKTVSDSLMSLPEENRNTIISAFNHSTEQAEKVKKELSDYQKKMEKYEAENSDLQKKLEEATRKTTVSQAKTILSRLAKRYGVEEMPDADIEKLISGNPESAVNTMEAVVCYAERAMGGSASAIPQIAAYSARSAQSQGDLSEMQSNLVDMIASYNAKMIPPS